MLLDTGVSPTSKFGGTEFPPLGWAAKNKHIRCFQDPSRRDSRFAKCGSRDFLTSFPVIRVSLFFSDLFSRAFLKESLGDLCFGIVKSHIIVRVESKKLRELK
jgi:hypothetical protein